MTVRYVQAHVWRSRFTRPLRRAFSSKLWRKRGGERREIGRKSTERVARPAAYAPFRSFSPAEANADWTHLPHEPVFPSLTYISNTNTLHVDEVKHWVFLRRRPQLFILRLWRIILLKSAKKKRGGSEERPHNMGPLATHFSWTSLVVISLFRHASKGR